MSFIPDFDPKIILQAVLCKNTYDYCEIIRNSLTTVVQLNASSTILVLVVRVVLDDEVVFDIGVGILRVFSVFAKTKNHCLVSENVHESNMYIIKSI